MKIYIENVRSFAGQYEIPIKPLTILVGENSAGKSSFLGIVHSVLSVQFPSTRQSFSSPPYELGSFDDIATYKGGKYGRASSFTVGIEKEGVATNRAIFVNDRGQPVLSNFSSKTNIGNLDIKFSRDQISGNVSLNRHGSRKADKFSFEIPTRGEMQLSQGALFNLILAGAFAKERNDKSTFQLIAHRHELVHKLVSLVTFTDQIDVLSLSPVRSKPRRTYDEFSDEFQPEGEHIPYVLARLLLDTHDVKRSKYFSDLLDAFGKGSGLFDDLKVQPLGKSPTSPFQVKIKKAGPLVNLHDVGYGVSQALPIAVESIQADVNRWLLLQQPEVHLHPRAQAQLGSLFTELAGKHNKKLIIETHSDYLLDRVRQEVASKTIKSADVQIIYFEKSKHLTNVHPISLDDNGNILFAPSSYRSFFLDEELKLLTRGDDA